MSRGSKAKPEGARSSLLSQQESVKLDELLGRGCASVVDAVAQLFMALPHSPSVWSLQHTGVVSFVKDNPQRSYFIRMFDLKTATQVWQQELYDEIIYSSPQAYFHTFAADDCQVGLNFATQKEAEVFLNAVMEKIHQRNSRHGKKQRLMPPSERGSLPPVPTEKANASPGGSPGSFPVTTVNIQNPDGKSSRYRSTASPTSSSAVLTGKGKKDKNKNKNKKKGTKLSKADIGAPSGFKHVSHVGWDPDNVDPDLWKLLSKAGISEVEMRDETTSQLIYDVIEQSGGMDAVKREMNRAGPPPPPPGRQGPLPPGSASPPRPPPPRGRPGPLPPIPAGQSQRRSPSPQLPAARGGLPPPPPPSSRAGPPPPPPPPPAHSPPSHFPPSKTSISSPTSPYLRPPLHPPSSQQRSVGLPPPPFPSPPPPQTSHSSYLPPPPPPSLLVSSPPPPPPAAAPAVAAPSTGDSRGALLDQIRHGKKLRNVTDCTDPAPPTPPESSEGIVGALMMVMQKRSKAIHSSEESEDEGGDEDDDDDEWDD